MFEPKPPDPKPDRRSLSAARPSQQTQQQRLMVAALALLLFALAFVLYRDRNFWFPDSEEVENQPLQAAPPQATPKTTTQVTTPQATARPMRVTREKHPAHVAQPRTATTVADAALPPTTITRTLLPPLEVEVVAGSNRKTVHPGTNSVHLDLQPAAASEASVSSPVANDTAASVTTEAAERGQISDATAEVVAHSVRPGYPMLARQMKVQGSVILEALIGRDGLIQDLRVLSGPPILATAAREAVRQWHFKPHFEGAEAVETQAKITVNFTISTN